MNLYLLPAQALLPSTGNPTLVQVDGSNLSWNELRYTDSADEISYFQFLMPDDYDGGNVTIQVFWKAAAAAGDVLFSIKHRALSDGDGWNVAGAAVDFAPDTAKATPEDLNKASKVLTAPWSPGQVIQLALLRKGTDAADTMAGDAKVLGVAAEFTIV